MDSFVSLLGRMLYPDVIDLSAFFPILLSDDSTDDSSDESSDDSSEDSSADSSDSDRNSVLTKKANYLEETVPNYDEDSFLSNFRFSRNVVDRLTIKYIRSSYYKEDTYGHYGKITAVNQVLIFLWYAAHQTASFRDVSDHFNIRIGTLRNIINRLTDFVSNLSPDIIKWPNEAGKKISEAYFRRKGFPNVIGAIGGIQVKIDKPKDDPDSYINKKGYYSIQAQIVCDHKHRIISIFVGYPGSVLDRQVLRKSFLFRDMKKLCGPYLILGDSRYPLLPNLITPFKDRGELTRAQVVFNIRLNRNRYVIEQCFGILKRKFRQLLHVKLKQIPIIVHFIRACCVLYNIALDGNIFFDEPIPLEVVSLSDDAEDVEAEDEIDARAVRQAIVNSFVV